MKTVLKYLPIGIAILFFSCEKESNYRFKGIPDEGDPVVVVPQLPSDGDDDPADDLLAFHEDFQSWKREGYDNLPTSDCEANQMTTATVMYVPSKPRVAEYNDFSVSYMLKDFAVNPVCGAIDGNSELSEGYVALQQLIFYECGQHDSDAFMQLSALPSVSQLRFSISFGGKIDDIAGISLWKKSENASSFTKVGDYTPLNPEIGEVFTVEINERNVQLKFIPSLTGKEIPVNDGINRAVRLHDLWVYSMKN